jgi:hypothetical protein
VATSILKDVKKLLGLADDYTAFDQDVILHINSAFSTLNQLGIGPDEGFIIEDASGSWEDYIGLDYPLYSVKTLVYSMVRLSFDPPTTSHHTTALKEQIQEGQWRLNTVRENRLHPETPEEDEELEGEEP